MVNRIFPYIRQYETHRQLAGRARADAGRVTGAPLDAIIVPASRPAANLDHAITLARAAGCRLVVFCSHETVASQVAELLAARCFTQAMVVQVPPGYHHGRLVFASSGLARRWQAEIRVNPNGDLSTKRNLGLLLARMLGWRRIFFMDDDIRDVGSADLAATVSLLGRYRSVGMRVTDFPDNSVVCHAHRETGAAQDVFVSGSVLAVSAAGPVAFFPEIYNEDWLFFYDDVRAQRLGWSGRNVTQLHYHPFRDAQRATGQEFGDVLAEGLYALLHCGEGAAGATRDFWGYFLAERERFLLNVVGRAHRAAPEIQEGLLAAVCAARAALSRVDPAMCETYICAWRRDLWAWTGGLAELPRAASAHSALRELGLTAVTDGLSRPSLPAATAVSGRTAAAGPVLLPRVATAGLRPGGSTGPGHGRRRRSRFPMPAAFRPGTPAGPPYPGEPASGPAFPWAGVPEETQPTPVATLAVTTDPLLMLMAANEQASAGLLAAGEAYPAGQARPACPLPDGEMSRPVAPPPAAG